MIKPLWPLLPGDDQSKPLSADLLPLWLALASALAVVIIVPPLWWHYAPDCQPPWSEANRELLRTGLYALAIVTLPLINLLRHIQLRLDQTMPRAGRPLVQTAKRRYALTVAYSLILIQSPLAYGLLLFWLGDPRNTLIIFALMTGLGLYLYRPKIREYRQILNALTQQDDA